jgi:hypothetical protein
MPADRDDAAYTGAGVRKPSMNETAGSGGRFSPAQCGMERGRVATSRAKNLRDNVHAGDRYTIADITALVAIDIGGALANIKIAPEFANLTRWHDLLSGRASAKA